jgi:hypothetical protein
MKGANKPMGAYAVGKLMGQLSGGRWGPFLLMMGGMTLVRIGNGLRERRRRRLAAGHGVVKGSR